MSDDLIVEKLEKLEKDIAELKEVIVSNKVDILSGIEKNPIRYLLGNRIDERIDSTHLQITRLANIIGSDVRQIKQTILKLKEVKNESKV